MKIKGVDFAAYSVTDLGRSIKFYQDTLGLPLRSQGESWAEFDAGNLAISIGLWGHDKKAKNNGAGVALAVDDVKATLVELKKKGVNVEDESWETPVCFGGSFEDLDGNKIYLHTRKDGTVG